MSLLVARNIAELEPYLELWEGLLPLENNIFYERWYLEKAIRAFENDSDLRIVLVFSDDNKSKLIALFPFVRHNYYGKLPISYLQLWKFPQCFLCTPLVVADNCDQAFAELFEWVKNENSFVRFKGIRADGPFFAELQNYLKKNNIFEDCIITERSLLQSDLSGDEYIKQHISGRFRHESKRKANKLAKLGNITLSELDQNSIDYNAWFEAFFEQEFQGWKGKQGTAIKCDPKVEKYFKEVLQDAFQRGQLDMQILKLDNTLLATRIFLKSNGCSYGVKISHNEDYKSYSPGLQLELLMLPKTLDEKKYIFTDSCAEPNHPLFGKIWGESRKIANLNFACDIKGKIFLKILINFRPLWHKVYKLNFLRKAK